ncbi:MAG: hypothetical protein CVU71_12560 [Deltaproteobacteria bacterium HGW-Deltaproteobacteria-6]|nr:MAG: hypothetical protein CVU71_12560 [Deltaproteobacteria bacterium HGW-Deltaproteobacteria-6]
MTIRGFRVNPLTKDNHIKIVQCKIAHFIEQRSIANREHPRSLKWFFQKISLSGIAVCGLKISQRTF